MPLSDQLKLRIVTWSVIGIGMFHLFYGNYDCYPLIHWTMFSDKEHRLFKSDRKSRTVIIAVDHRGEEASVNLKSFAGTFSGSGGASKMVAKDYLGDLLSGNKTTAALIARQIEKKEGIKNIAALRVEKWTWVIDKQKFISGSVDFRADPENPDTIRSLKTINLDSETPP